MLETIAYWWLVIVVAFGCLLATLLLLYALHVIAWKLLREVVGWPTLIRILREHRAKGDKP